MQKRPIRNSTTSIGGVIRVAGALAPLVIGEFIKDPEKRWRYIRIAAIAVAIASATVWRNRVKREREYQHQIEELAL